MHHYVCEGDRVILVDDYYQFHDAFHGPLTPGDEGLIISCDIHSGVIRALVVVLGRKWYYDKRALRRAPANGGPTLSFGAGPAAGSRGFSFGTCPAVAVNKPTPVRFNFPANF